MAYRDFEEFLDAGSTAKKAAPASYSSFEDFLDKKPETQAATGQPHASFEDFLDAPATPAKKQYTAPVISANPEHDDLYDAPGSDPLTLSQTAGMIGQQIGDAATHFWFGCSAANCLCSKLGASRPTCPL